MADIFLSYNEKDRPRVRLLAQALERAGWSVWWDRRVPAGLTWRSLLEQELQNMRCMLVLWSAHSIKSEWVCEEATEGRLLGRLIPVFLERVRPPAGFREVQAADLVDWDGTHDTLGLQQLLDDIAHKLATTAVVPQDPAPRIAVSVREPPHPPSAWNLWKQGGLAAALLMVAVGIYLGVGAVARREAVLPMADPPAASTPSAAVVAEPPTFGMPTTIPNTSANVPPPIVTATAPPAKPPVVTTKRPLPARCNAIRERQGMGEMPSAADQTFLNKEC